LIPVNEKYTSDYDRQLKIKNLINDFFNDKTRSFVQVREETNSILILGVVVAFLLVFAYLGYLIWQVQHPKEEE